MTIDVKTRNDILKRFEIFQGGTGGLDSWLGADTPEKVLEVLNNIENQPLSRALLNQLLTISSEAPVSDAFFRYYWLNAPDKHPYDVRKVAFFDERWIELDHIGYLDQLYWGLYRFYVDALLYFGNIRTAFQVLRNMSSESLTSYFREHYVDPEGLKARGQPIGLEEIARDSRYLISEMACKSFDTQDVPEGELAHVLSFLAREHFEDGGGPITVDQLLTGAYKEGQFTEQQLQFEISTEEFKDELFTSENDLLRKIEPVARKFENARNAALENTRIYLSMVGDLDVYVATSMRNREDFRYMASFCDEVFTNKGLDEFNLRYFDPTLSAAAHHEDKGLIECLMVKCAKVLVLHAGDRDSYGKDAEAAMALSLGKPVIIHTSKDERQRFFRDIHPLSRLIQFNSGVAIGAMVATSPTEVAELLKCIFSSRLEYELSQPREQYLVLKEKITESVVRLQTSDDLLRETFWNHYHSDIR